MRPLVLALGALLALTLGAPVIGVAQEATPTAETAVSELTRTDLRYVVPYTPDGLNPGLTVTATEEGICGFASSQALDRPDAWDCISASSQVYDPCFENPFVLPDDLGEVACFDSPFSTDVVVLTLTQPLARQKEAPDTGMSMAQAVGVSIDPWDLPWAVELANGEQCTLLHGTLAILAGQVAHYGCVGGGTILGEVNHQAPRWTANYLADGDYASSLVDVVTAWS